MAHYIHLVAKSDKTYGIMRATLVQERQRCDLCLNQRGPLHASTGVHQQHHADGNVLMPEIFDLLRNAILEDLKIFLGHIGNLAARRVLNRNV